MKNKNLYLISLLFIGLIMGFAISSSLESNSTYCQEIENSLKINQSFNGSAACYEPGKINVNLSEKVRNNTDLKCVCRIIELSGNQRIFPITSSN